MTRQQRRAIEREFYNYEANKKKAVCYVASHAFDGLSVDYFRPHVRTGGANGVEDRVINELAETECAWKWCRVYELTFNRFRWEKKDELMNSRFVKKRTVARTCMEIGIERRTYFYWLDEILFVAMRWAEAFGVIKPI